MSVVNRIVGTPTKACDERCKRPFGLVAELLRVKPCPAKPATAGATTPQGAKTNLNTATAAELDKLPQIGPARSKAIIEARTKAKFRDWNDFVARKVVPAEAAAAIKDVVAF